MVAFAWPTLLAIVAIPSAAATPLPGSSDLTEFSSHVMNLSAPVVVNPRFRTVIASEGTDILNTNAGLMAIVKMMYRLTECNFYGVMEPGTYVDGGLPAVSASIKAPPGVREIQTRFVVWGIFQASQYIARTKIVRNYTWALQFDNSDVGYIELSRTLVQPSLAGGSSNAQDQTQSSDGSSFSQSLDDNHLNLTSPPEKPIELTYYTIPDGEDLTKFEVFANIFTGLAYIAGFPSGNRLQSRFQMHSLIFPQTMIGFRPKTTPSVLKYYHTAIVLFTLSYRMLVAELFSEMFVKITMDERLVGEGYIVRARYRPSLQIATT